MSLTAWTNVWYPLETREPCGHAGGFSCFEVADFEEERTAEQVTARLKPRLRCLRHLPEHARLERYPEEDRV